MDSLVFQIKFLSDIVLPATSNTEGNIQQLDFIAGSSLLGIVATQYNNFEDSFNVFHSGAVRFGDGTILKDDKQTYKMPLSFFYKKLSEIPLYNHHLLSDNDFQEFGQLKQERKGYITKDIRKVKINYNYTQKSAYDKNLRRSKESSMFGYSSIESGTKWQFTLKYDNSIISNKDLELIKSTLIGKQRLGKSKSAQYGLVEISLNGKNEKISTENATIHKNETILYLNSRVSLVDKEGNPTYDLKYICDGLNDENIIYPKTQIRKSSFSPYNRARETKDYERICLNKGSVIVLKDITKQQLDEIKKGIGLFLNEGFGDIIINPSFLMTKEIDIKKESENTIKKDNPKITSSKNNIVQFLINKRDDNKKQLEILKEVDEFIIQNKSLYRNINNSQWGKIRSLCINNSEETLKNEIEDYIGHGIKEWDNNQKKKILEISKNLQFVKILSILMPKENNKRDMEKQNEN
jgi:hypothetical protein